VTVCDPNGGIYQNGTEQNGNKWKRNQDFGTAYLDDPEHVAGLMLNNSIGNCDTNCRTFDQPSERKGGAAD